MGVCLCKDKVTDENSDDLSPYAAADSNREQLSVRVDKLVKETLGKTTSKATAHLTKADFYIFRRYCVDR